VSKFTSVHFMQETIVHFTQSENHCLIVSGAHNTMRGGTAATPL